MMAELQGVKAIENAAIRAPGRTPRDTRHARAPDRHREPATRDRGEGVRHDQSRLRPVAGDPNIRQGDPAHFTLKVLGGERLARLLGRAKEKRHHVLRSMRPRPRR